MKVRPFSKSLYGLLVVAVLCGIVGSALASSGDTSARGQRAGGDFARGDSASSKCAKKTMRTVATSSSRSKRKRILLACAHGLSYGSIKILGYRYHHEACVEMVRGARQEIPGGFCSLPKTSMADTWCFRRRTACEVEGGRSSAYSETFGVLPPKAVALRVFVNGKRRRALIAIGRVVGKAKRKLRTDEAFGVFAIVLRGCVEPIDVKILMYTAQGKKLGKVQKRPSVVGGCEKISEEEEQPAQ